MIRGPNVRQAGWPGMWVSSAQARQPRTLHPTRCGRDARGAGLVHRAPSKVSPFTQQAPVEYLLCASSVLGAGPTGLKKHTGPCPHGTVLERENIVTSLPTRARWVLPAAQDHTASSGPRGLFRWPAFKLLSPQHSPHSRVSFSGVPPCTETSEDSSLCVSLGTVAAPRFCFSRVSSGRNELRQGLVTAVPRPCLPCRSPAKASFTAWCRHLAGRSQEATEGETQLCHPQKLDVGR